VPQNYGNFLLFFGPTYLLGKVASTLGKGLFHRGTFCSAEEWQEILVGQLQSILTASVSDSLMMSWPPAFIHRILPNCLPGAKAAAQAAEEEGA
jgi:hypothetical protein